MRKLAEESFVVEFVKRIRKKAPGIGGGKLWRIVRERILPRTLRGLQSLLRHS